MANTFSQIYIQIIFSTKGRIKTIRASFRDELFKYISGIIKRKGQTPLAVNGTTNHIHIFVGLKPEKAISDLVRDIKHFSTKFVNDKKLSNVKFYWQEGYAAFSYSHSQIDSVIKYIINQEKHHKSKTFQEEYREFMNKFNVKYDERYLFDR
jgi:REP element-mobilizing transposase RayT